MSVVLQFIRTGNNDISVAKEGILAIAFIVTTTIKYVQLIFAHYRSVRFFFFSLENVLNYPNPFVNYTEFWFNHNQPNAPLEVKVFIYTVSGKLVNMKLIYWLKF